jgi:hypothetical protein
MHLRISGFFPEPNEDDSLQFKRIIQEDLVPDVIKIMGWSDVSDAAGGESELTPEQSARLIELLNEPAIEDLTLFIGRRA